MPSKKSFVKARTEFVACRPVVEGGFTLPVAVPAALGQKCPSYLEETVIHCAACKPLSRGECQPGRRCQNAIADGAGIY